MASSKAIDVEFWSSVLNVNGDDCANLEKYPKFLKLLELLKANLSGGKSSKLSREVKEANAVLNTSKSNFLAMTTVYSIITQYYCEPNGEADELLRKIKEIVVHKEVQQKLVALQLEALGTAKTTHGLMGITESRPKIKLSDEDVRCLHDVLQSKLQIDCGELMQLYDRMTDTGKREKRQFPNVKVSTEECHFFCSIIENKKKELKENQEKLQTVRRNHQLLILKYYKNLYDAVKSMIELGEICNDNNYSSKKSQIMILKSQVLLLKMRVFRLQVLSEIYQENTVKTHSKINECLDSAINKKGAEKVLAQHRLAVYESVGSQFHTLLNEYIDVKTKSEQRAWMLSMLPGVAEN